MLLPGEITQAYSVNVYEETRSNNGLREVSRGIVEWKKWEGLNNRKPEERKKGGQCDENRISWKQGLPAE